MATNRLNRDEILNRALDLADSAVLDSKDRPEGIIVTTALSITWLQEALDYFHKKFPFQAALVTTPVTISENDITITLPADFIQDYKDGILLDDDGGRLIRRGLSELLNRSRGTTASPVRGTPDIYAIRGGLIEFAPKAQKAFTGTLYYYKLPAVITESQIPNFPDDFILVQYVWIKAQEWHRVVGTGSALQFANDRIADLQKSGIGNEAEEDVIPLAAERFGEFAKDRFLFPFDR